MSIASLAVRGRHAYAREHGWDDMDFTSWCLLAICVSLTDSDTMMTVVRNFNSQSTSEPKYLAFDFRFSIPDF